MEDPRLRRYFLEPASIYQRQYEALRACFVEGRAPKHVAEQFGYACSSLRSLASRFCAQVQAGEVPPFLLSLRSGVGRARPRTRSRPDRRLPTRRTARS